MKVRRDKNVVEVIEIERLLGGLWIFCLIKRGLCFLQLRKFVDCLPPCERLRCPCVSDRVRFHLVCDGEWHQSKLYCKVCGGSLKRRLRCQ